MLLPAYIIEELKKREQQISNDQPLSIQIEYPLSGPETGTGKSEAPEAPYGVVELDYFL